MELEGNGYMIGKMKGGIKRLFSWMVSLHMYFSFFVIFKEFVLVSPRCWSDSEKKDEGGRKIVIGTHLEG